VCVYIHGYTYSGWVLDHHHYHLRSPWYSPNTICMYVRICIECSFSLNIGRNLSFASSCLVTAYLLSLRVDWTTFSSILSRECILYCWGRIYILFPFAYDESGVAEHSFTHSVVVLPHIHTYLPKNNISHTRLSIHTRRPSFTAVQLQQIPLRGYSLRSSLILYTSSSYNFNRGSSCQSVVSPAPLDFKRSKTSVKYIY